MDSNVAVGSWQKLLLGGESLNRLKRLLLSTGNIQLVQQVEHYETQVESYFIIFDSEMSIQNVRLDYIDVINLTVPELKTKLEITESCFDFLELDLSKFINHLIEFSEELIYLHSDLEKCTNDSQDLLDILWEIHGYINELIIFLDPDLENI